jgi:hypothetical protein
MCLAQESDEAKYRQGCGESDIERDICEARRKQGTASMDLPETTWRQGETPECSDDNVAETVDEAEEVGEAEDESENGGAMRYRRRQMQDQFETDEYLRRRECPRAHKSDIIRCKKGVTPRNGGRQWIKNYTACYLWGQPQSVCTNWAAIWALWEQGWEERRWVRSRLEVEVSDGGKVTIAAPRVVKFADVDCIVGVKILAGLLGRWSGD